MLKKSLSLIVVICLILILAACSGSNNNLLPEEEYSSLTVTVKDASDDSNIEGASVILETISSDTTDSEGDAQFEALNVGDYEISVASTGYVAAESEVTIGSSDKTRTIKLAPEQVQQEVTTQSESVGNGLCDMDFNDEDSDQDAKDALSNQTVTVEENDQDAVEILSNSGTSLGDAGLSQTAQPIGPSFNFSFSTLARQTYHISKVVEDPWVKIKIDLGNLVDNLNNIDSERYSLLVAISTTASSEFTEFIVPENITIDQLLGKICGTIPVTIDGVAIDEIVVTLVYNQDENIDLATDLSDAKNFVGDLKTHGLALRDAGQQQAQKIEDNLKNEVVPYMVSLGYGFHKISDIIEIWGYIVSQAFENEYGVGEFTVNVDNWDTDEAFIISGPSPAENLAELSTWDYTINFTNTGEEDLGTATISITNPIDLYNYEETIEGTYITIDETIDFRNAEFTLDYTEAIGNVNYSLDCSLDSSSYELVEFTDTDTYYDYDELYTEEWNTTVYVPTVSTAQLDGTIEDDTITDEDGVFSDIYGQIFGSTEDIPAEIPVLDSVTINNTLSVDFNNNNDITFNGSFVADAFTYSGNGSFDFIESPLISLENEEYPLLDSINLEMTNFETNVFRISGGLDVDFTTKTIQESVGYTYDFSVPDEITYQGTYQDISIENGFKLDGTLVIDPYFEDFSIDLTEEYMETEDNYLGGKILLSGSLTNATDANFNLAYFNIYRDGYHHGSTEFRYEFGSGHYIEGEASFGEGQPFKFRAANDQNLSLNMKVYDWSSVTRVGTIKNYYENKLYGEIYTDTDPYVNYSDNTTETLLPSE